MKAPTPHRICPTTLIALGRDFSPGMSWVVTALLATLTLTSASADVVYVTSLTSNCVSTAVCGNLPNADVNINGLPVYDETGLGSFTSAVAVAPRKPPTPGARFFSNSYSNTTPDFGVTISPTLATTGGVYRLYHVYSSAAGNVSTNIILGVTNVDGCTLSFATTDKFQRSFGVVTSGQNAWQQLGYVTNNADTSTPTIRFYYQDGIVNAGASQRLLIDTFRFILDAPCLDVPAVATTGPMASNIATVIVTGVSPTATKINVFQDSGAGATSIGEVTTSSPPATVSVPVTGLVKGGLVSAAQTVGGLESCLPATQVLAGGGANPRVRVVYTIRETSSTGPVGAPATDTSSANLHFLGSSNVVSGSPGSGPVLVPSAVWQTLTLQRGSLTVGDSANADGSPVTGGGYLANDSIGVEVFAYKTTYYGVTYYSATAAQSPTVTSNDVFNVNWTWDAVPGAQGYRVLRNLNGFGFGDYVDVTVNSYSDDNTGWNSGETVTPTTAQVDTSIRWNPSVANLNDLPGAWGILESINFAIDDLTDTGPYDLYIDNLQNGTTVWQTFENSVAGAQDISFRAPSFSGTTAGNILGAPNLSAVSNLAADTGTKSLRIRFQWNGTTATKWLRLTTSGVGNPMVNLADPISIRFLLLPVNTSPVPPAAPTLSINSSGGTATLNWTGAHNLQAAPQVTGTYTNIPGITVGPYSDPTTPPPAQRFFRLAN